MMVQKEYIIKLHQKQGESIRRIAKLTGHSRETIRKMLQDSEVPRYHQKQERHSPVTDSVRPIVAGWLEEDKDKTPDMRHTAKRIYDRLVEEYKFTGCESIIRKMVRSMRNKSRECFMLLTSVPGEQAQVDFGEFAGTIDGVKQKIYYFCMILKYSRVPFVMAFPTNGTEAFIEGHLQAFSFFGGVPGEILYDNASPLVKKVLDGPSRELTDTFRSFRAHYRLETLFCRPAKGNEKGSVEALVKESRRNAMIPDEDRLSYPIFNQKLLHWCIGKREKQAQAWEEEKKALRSLPDRSFTQGILKSAKVNRYALVYVDHNRYSVPSHLVGELVLIRKNVFSLDVLYKDQCVCSHTRRYGRGGVTMDIRHYLDVLSIKKHAVTHAQVVRELPEPFQKARDIFKNRGGEDWYREYANLLLLLKGYSLESLQEAIETKIGQLSYESVLECLKAPLPQVQTHIPSAQLDRFDALWKKEHAR